MLAQEQKLREDAEKEVEKEVDRSRVLKDMMREEKEMRMQVEGRHSSRSAAGDPAAAQSQPLELAQLREELTSQQQSMLRLESELQGATAAEQAAQQARAQLRALGSHVVHQMIVLADACVSNLANQ